jgi:hypothetical protein
MSEENKPHNDDEDILSIDKYRLDEAWLKQAELYSWYAQELADSRRKVDEKKAQLEVVKADLGMQIRRDPEAFGVTKTTEKMIDSLVVLQDKHVEVTKELIEARHKYDCLTGLLAALDHKKKALEKLVDLQGRDYFSEPVSRMKDNTFEEQRRDNVAKRGVIRKNKRSMKSS